MRWLFLSAWVIAITSISSFVWLLRVPTGNEHTFYTSVISMSDSQNMITVFGKIFIENEAIILPLSDGNVTEVFVKPGDKVSEGQILATLDYRAEDLELFEKVKKISQESGSIDRLNQKLEEIGQLELKGFFDAAEAAKKRADIYSSIGQILNYKLNLQKQFEQTHGKILRAEFAGIVTDVRLKKGQRVSIRDDQSMNLISIAPTNATHGVEMEVNDEYLFRLKKDQRILVSSPFTTDESYPGTITAIANMAFDDKKKRYFKVIGKISDQVLGQSRLASGMKVSISIQTDKEEDDLTWIPKAAFDINLETHLISSKMNFIPKQNRSIASSRSDDYSSKNKAEIDKEHPESTSARKVKNDLFPNESQASEVYLLTPDNKVVEAKVLRLMEAGEMVAISGTDLQGMRVITHYRPKDTSWSD